METLDLLIDLHRKMDRQGPGSEAITQLMFNYLPRDYNQTIKVLDLGCGTGASTLALAQFENIEITAVDIYDEFLTELNFRAGNLGTSAKITTLKASMDDLPFEKESFDVIWAEGAIYNIGFKKGLEYIKQFLKPEGFIGISEISWITATRPEKIEKFWIKEYPEIKTISGKIADIENLGFTPLSHLVLPQQCWVTNYYQPLADSFEKFLNRHLTTPIAKDITQVHQNEFAQYETYKDYYSYGFYLAQKL